MMSQHVMFVLEMEIVPEGKNFRLVTEDELPAVADFLVQYMPESLKVRHFIVYTEKEDNTPCRYLRIKFSHKFVITN